MTVLKYDSYYELWMPPRILPEFAKCGMLLDSVAFRAVGRTGDRRTADILTAGALDAARGRFIVEPGQKPERTDLCTLESDGLQMARGDTLALHLSHPQPSSCWNSQCTVFAGTARRAGPF